MQARVDELGERALRESVPLPTFYESLVVDESSLQPLNLTRIKEEL